MYSWLNDFFKWGSVLRTLYLYDLSRYNRCLLKIHIHDYAAYLYQHSKMLAGGSLIVNCEKKRYQLWIMCLTRICKFLNGDNESAFVCSDSPRSNKSFDYRFNVRLSCIYLDAQFLWVEQIVLAFILFLSHFILPKRERETAPV